MTVFGRRLGPLGVGAAIVAVYAAAVVATLPFGHGARPLFEGIGPPPAYRWVHPPAAFAAGNVPPRTSDTDVPLGPEGSEQAGVLSEDSQLVLNLAPKSILPHPPDKSADVRVIPLDPATLGPAPAGLRPNGNVYQVRITYKPSGLEVASLAAAGNVLLTVPEPT